MNTREMIAVMQAFEDGKQIEYKSNFDDKWEQFYRGDNDPVWDWHNVTYRIKPTKKPVDLSVLIDSGIDMATKDELDRLKDLLQTTGTNLIGTRESERLEIVRCQHCDAIKNIYQFGDVPHKENCPVAKITEIVWECDE